MGSAERHQLLLQMGPVRLFFLTCRHLRSCRGMPEERGMLQPWGGGQGAEPEAATSQGSPQIFSSAPLCHSAASALPAFCLRSSCLPLSMGTHPGQGMQSHCALVIQVSMESSDGDGEGMALASPPAPCVHECSAFPSWQASLSIAPSKRGFSLC